MNRKKVVILSLIITLSLHSCKSFTINKSNDLEEREDQSEAYYDYYDYDLNDQDDFSRE